MNIKSCGFTKDTILATCVLSNGTVLLADCSNKTIYEVVVVKKAQIKAPTKGAKTVKIKRKLMKGLTDYGK